MADETTEWANRVIDALSSGDLIELDEDTPRDTLLRGISTLLAKHGDRAKNNADVADELAEQLSEVEGVGELFVTTEELQKILKKTDA